MTCPSCHDVGVFKVFYFDDEGPTDDPPTFAICLCRAGESMRLATNNGRPVTPQWQVWAFRHGVPLEHVQPMEDVFSTDDLAERGFREVTPVTALDAIAAAARARSTKR